MSWLQMELEEEAFGIRVSELMAWSKIIIDKWHDKNSNDYSNLSINIHLTPNPKDCDGCHQVYLTLTKKHDGASEILYQTKSYFKTMEAMKELESKFL